MPPASPDPMAKSAAFPLARPPLLYLVAALAAVVALLLAVIVAVAVFGRGGATPDDVMIEDTVDASLIANTTGATASGEGPPSPSTRAVPARPPQAPILTSTERVASSSTETQSDETTRTGSAEDAIVIEPITEHGLPEEETTSMETTTTAATTTEQPRFDVSACAALPVQPTSCPSITRKAGPASPTGPSAARLLAYHANISVGFVVQETIRSDFELFLQPAASMEQIALDAGRFLRFSPEEVFVVGCESGRTLCARTEHDPHRQLLTISLASESSEPLRLVLRGVQTLKREGATPNPSLFQQTPVHFNRAIAALAGSHFGVYDDVKQVLPTLPAQRAPLTLCLTHDAATGALSNTQPLVSRDATATRDGRKTTCFEETPPLPAHHYAFLAHQNTESLSYNVSTLPSLDIFFSYVHNFAATKAKHNWIHREANASLALLSNWFALPFPLARLSLIAAPVEESRAAGSSLGHIVLVERNMENPMKARTHTDLLRRLISQWIGGVVSAAPCFEDALVSYLSWQANDELKYAKRERNTTGQIAYLRPSFLPYSKKPAKLPFGAARIASSAPSCADRFPAVFHAIDGHFGMNVTRELAARMVNAYAYQNTTLEEWAEELKQLTQDEAAAILLMDWFIQPAPPLLAASISSAGVNITQLHLHGETTASHLWTLPLELAGSRGVQPMTLQPVSQQTLPYTSDDYVIVDPRRRSTAVVLYDVDAYHRLLRCSDDSRCPVNKEELRSVFADFGAFFIADKIDPPTAAAPLAAYRDLMRRVQHKGFLTGEAACCTAYAAGQPESSVDRLCRFTIVDLCRGIRLAQTLR